MHRLILLLFTLGLSGCLSTRTLVLAPEPDPSVVAYLDSLGDHVGGWVTAGPDTLFARRLRIEGWDLLVDPLPASPRRRYRLVDVSTIDIHDSRKSLLYGLAGGAGVAAGAGAIAALLADPSGRDASSRTDAGLRAAAITGVFTLPIGFVLGVGGAGHRVRIEIAPGLRP